MQLSQKIRACRRWTLIVMFAAVALAFDTSTFDVFNLTKFTIVMVGTVVVVALWGIESVQRGKLLIPRTGIELPLLALLAATAISTALTFSPVIGIFGFYKSYDGLLSVTCFVLLALAVAEVFDDRRQLRNGLVSMAFVAGIGAALYGLLQYITFATGCYDVPRPDSCIKLDWENWGVASFKTAGIFSTFGNPNHFAGFMAMAIPLVVGVGFSSKEKAAKVVATIFSAVAFLQILQVQTRGAWVAVALAALGLGIVFWPELRSRPVVLAGVAVGILLAVGFAGVFLTGRGNLFTRIGTTFTASDPSGRQRILLWEAGIRSWLSRPLFGWGPDTFRVIFLRFQGWEFYSLYGHSQVANGPHNVFISWLFSTGIVGFAAFVWLNVVAFKKTALSALTARRIEVSPPKREGRRYVDEARRDRIALGSVGCALLAFLSGESFNVNQIALSFAYYSLLGMAGAYSVLVDRTQREIAQMAEKKAKKKGGDRTNGKPKKGRGRRILEKESLRTSAGVAMVIAVLVGVPLIYLATRFYAADGHYRDAPGAIEAAKKSQQEAQSGRTQSADGRQVSPGQYLDLADNYADDALRRLRRAVTENPFESRYFYDIFEMEQLKAFLAVGGHQQLMHLERAEEALRTAIRINPEDARQHRALGDLYAYWGGAHPPPRANANPPDPSKLELAVEELLLARRYNPYDWSVDEVLYTVATKLENRELQIDAASHGEKLGHGTLAANLAGLLAEEGDRQGAIDLLNAYIARHGNQPDVDRKLAELTGTADGGGESQKSQDPETP